MFRNELALQRFTEKTNTVDRRTMLERSVGVALAGTIFGTLDMLTGDAAVAGQQGSATSAAQQSSSPNKGIRRIVTGHNAQGKSYVVSDTRIMSGHVYLASTENPLGPGAAGDSDILMSSTMPRIEPPLGGSASSYVYFPPRPADYKPLWHRTMTLDYNFLISGELVLMLEEGEVVLTGPGDVVVQRNTNHAWRNNSTTAPLIYVAVLEPLPQKKFSVLAP